MAFNTKDNMQQRLDILHINTTTSTTPPTSALTAANPPPPPPPTPHHQLTVDHHQGSVSAPNNNSDSNNSREDWESVKCKAEILGHPLYEQLFTAHVSCLRIATPVDQLPRIDAQLGQSQDVMAKYSALGNGAGHLVDSKELDQFMGDVKRVVSFFKWMMMMKKKMMMILRWGVLCENLFVDDHLVVFLHLMDGSVGCYCDTRILMAQFIFSNYQHPCFLLCDENGCYHAEDKTHYVLLLYSFKDQLQQHVRVHAMEAVMACWELEQSLQSLTGVSPGEGTGATMSDDDEDQADSDLNLYDGSLDGTDSMGFGPLVPTETERSLMERVRLELKHELKQVRCINYFGVLLHGATDPISSFQGYKEKIVDIREEILRKRRAGKLPGDTTSLLKAWWQSHAKWPYPTEEDKAKLVQETGLQLKQINNWFINQRKRNWHSNPSSSTSSKTKRKR
ncbi:hypothetical protein Pint_14701 [Pistacia integerrima]|uniref:Uncharacterized protein n=1 Tax=Pistacia integerrima TaxID=434235 RepID=A0ACC0Y5P3_9ROSI|nr:hypothetical protein Pint_14701 [Pistacia integerrima]